ncbi:mucin-2-like [Engraulis encrasicolus]|uniref:mucin-2-like n=1 Tax=Engraulis encrasicolus TaxID=184585 RepID=UPI002FD6A362
MDYQECRTFGSGVVAPFKGDWYHVRTSCSFIVTRFTHQAVQVDVTAQRGLKGLMSYVSIVINKIRTIVDLDGKITVDKNMVSLPYDHTYQHIFPYGAYTRLSSTVLPLTITWHSSSQGISSLWDCQRVMSISLGCIGMKTKHYFHLCRKNSFGQASNLNVTCPFYRDLAHMCGPGTATWNEWRDFTSCPELMCPGDLTFQELGNAFIPTCSNPKPRTCPQDMTSTCVCPPGMLLNDREEGHRCVSLSECPCVHYNKVYPPGSNRTTKCQNCLCVNGRWHCTDDICDKKCSIESQFVKTFDGKHFRIPGRCSYVAAQGANWTMLIHFDDQSIKLKKVEIHHDGVSIVFWQSSMYVQIICHSGLSIQVQMSPEIQVYLYLPDSQRETTSGLCGNFNGDSGDDFTTSSGIVENSAKAFALSWSLGACTPDINPICTDMDKEMFAEQHCKVLKDYSGVFSSCHPYVPYEKYYEACLARTCQCHSVPHSCLCVALGNYAKACAYVGKPVGDWRMETNCSEFPHRATLLLYSNISSVMCTANQVFSYSTSSCNRTCHSVTGPDPTCMMMDGSGMETEMAVAPVEGCGCPAGSYRNSLGSCVPTSLCDCYSGGMTVPPGRSTINGLSWGECVSANNCTCMFSGTIYGPGESVKSDCKTCTCTGGRWHCSGEPCPGKCQVFGNGHYQTFDHKWYSFNGNCEYTLVEDDCGSGIGTFAVRVESIPCCDEELTCSRTITLDMDNGMYLTFDQSNMSAMHYKKSGSGILVEKVGLYIVASVPSLGLTLIWDRNTRLTVLLARRWKDRVCGLCGNYDASEANDLQGLSPLEFGNSWKTGTPPCSDVRNETFPCETHSYCSHWAQRRCMIITGDTFKACHLKVDPGPYYAACVLEACACQFEGRFLGFCTAVAAYAEACSEQDVCIRWRTPDLCPVFCDYYNKEGQCTWHYDPCGNVPTCGTDYFKGKLEGCFPRCPAETPYYDEKTGQCLRNCTPDCPGNPGRCEVWSDPHYITFHGTYYRFMGACTYTLVQERVPQYNFSVMVDNAHCFGKTTVSCARGAMLNNDTVDSHLEKYGIRFDVGPGSVSVYIDQIRSHISMATGARVTITLGMEYFQNNTEGQCGVCGGASCVRPSGQVEEDYCCPETAYDWIVPDPRKPMCNNAPRNVSCDVTPPPPTTLCPAVSVCDILYGPVFEECRRLVDLSRLYESCRFDVCNTLPNVSCSSFAQAAELCQSVDVCVDWCEHTNGACDCYVDRASDIAFLLDGSGSVSFDDFQTMKDFVIDLIKKLPQMKFAVAQYASGTITHFNFNQFNSSGMFESQINGITQISGGTNTARAICTVVDTLFVPAAGLRNFTTRVLIVITDGQSSDSLQLPDCVAEAEAEDITRYAIGVGQAFNRPDARKELETIASSVDNHVFHVNNFDALESISVALGRTIRDQCPMKTTVPPTHHPPTTTPVTTTMTTTTITMETTTTTLPPTTTPTPSTTMTTTLPPTTTPTPSTTMTTTLPPTTTPTPSTTMTTTLPPTTTPTPSTTMTTTLPPTTTPTPSTTMTTTLRPTLRVITQSTAKAITSEMYWNTTTPPITTPPCGCLDSNNVRRRVGEIWMESCRTLECLDGGVVKMTPVPCPELTTPACPGGKVVTVMGECCAMRKCFCECVVSGDPHYYTFSGLNYDFMGACTYTLVQERHGMTGLAFSIVVDNEFCFGIPTVSCAKGILITFRGFLIHLILDSFFGTPYVTLNGSRVNPPANLEFFVFENIPNGVSVHIVQPGIYVSMQTGGHVVIRLNYQFFRNNTEGQCGVCGGPPCVRPNGMVENDDCCPMTAYDWKVDDPTKPMCKNASRNVPCGPPLPPPTPCPESDVCDKIFDIIDKCESDISVEDVEALMKNCRFDVCNIPNITCFYLERAAELCPECIKWRHLVNGMCNGSCENGMVYEECREVSDDHCCGSVRAPGRSFIDPHSGCFCPKNQARAGPHGQCVDICTDCQDPYGYPKQPGDTWEVDCNICTCDNLTRSTQCVKRPIIHPICLPGSTVTPTGCCGDQTCTPLPGEDLFC